MDYKEMRKEVENMINNNYSDFVKAVVSVELGINDEKGLDLIYDKYMEDDSAGLLTTKKKKKNNLNLRQKKELIDSL